MESSERALPHAVGPEQSVLSSILKDPEEYISLANELGLTDGDFYHPCNAKLYRVLLDRHAKGQSVDVVTLAQDLLEKGMLEQIGGAFGLGEIMSYSPTNAHFKTHLGIVRKKSLLRRIIKSSTEALEAAYSPDTDPDELLEDVETKALTMRSEGSMTDESIGMNELMKLCAEHYEQCQKHRGFGISTGFADLDFKTGGLHPGDLIITAARPSIGKTALAMAFMEHQTVEKGIPVLFFSTEMGRLSVGHRLIAAHARLNLGRLVQGDKIDKEIINKTSRSMAVLKESPLRLVDTPGMTASEIRARTRREIRKHDIKVVYIDYLQLLRGSNRTERENPLQRIGNALKVLKLMAREMNIPVVVLAQLSRVAEDKLCEQLNNAMVKDCGEIEQDADAIFMIGKVENDGDSEYSVKRGINITKQRQGPTGCIPPVEFQKTSAKFVST